MLLRCMINKQLLLSCRAMRNIALISALIVVIHQCVLWTTIDPVVRRTLSRSVSSHPYIDDEQGSSDEVQTTTTTSSGRTLSIVDYLNAHTLEPHHFILLKWDEVGQLDLPRMNASIEESFIPHWFGLEAQELFVQMETKPSPHGTVALLLNSDLLMLFDWDVVPPIPLLVYTEATTAVAELSKNTIPSQLDSSIRDAGSEHHHENVWLIPNPYDHGGFNRLCVSSVQQVAVDFSSRNNTVIWRGNIHSREDETSRIQLLEVVAVEHNHSGWLDVKSTNDEIGRKAQVSMEDMVQYKYQLDIGGLSGTSWGGLRWKMCSGSLVFKVDTWSKDWWHDEIRPWQEYIPVKGDMSDLHAGWKWAEQNPEEAAKIAAAGRKVCDLTLSEDYISNFLENSIRSLPPGDKERVKEADLILDGIVPIWKEATVSTE